MAILRNILLDILVGMIPILGIVFDIFYKSYRKNFDIIVGFVNDDREIIRDVNKKAVSTTIWIIIIGVAIYYLIIYLWAVLKGVVAGMIGFFS